MASNINPYNIDGTFPVAGQDNSSQGFRDNFTNTKNNFLFAQSEINDLQSKALVTSALNGQSINNDMAGTQIIRPQLSAWTQTIYDLGTVSTNAVLDFNTANFQKITTPSSGSGIINISFANWPSSTGTGALGYGVMRVWFNVQTVGYTIQLPASVDIAASSIAGDNGYGLITFDTPGNYIFDFSSVDGGNNYLIMDLTRNRSTFVDPGFYYNDMVNSTVLIGYGSALSEALNLEQGQDKVSSLGSYNSVAVGNLSVANVTIAQTDVGGLGGYSVSAARGSLSTVTSAGAASSNAVKSGDYLGYVNSIAVTGAGTGSNVFQQLSTISFFATGSNVVYGLGGNIGFFTADDGGKGPNQVTQAVGIENDQSTHFFGNVFLSNLTTSPYYPTTSTSPGKPGQIAWAASVGGISYFYVCIGNNSWVRSSMSGAF